MTHNKLPYVAVVKGQPRVMNVGQMWVNTKGEMMVVRGDGVSVLATGPADPGLDGEKWDTLSRLDAVLAKYTNDNTELFLLDLIHELYLRYYDRQEQDDDSEHNDT